MSEKNVKEVLAGASLADFTVHDDGRVEVRNLELANAVRGAAVAKEQQGFNLFCPTNYKCTPQKEEQAPQ